MDNRTFKRTVFGASLLPLLITVGAGATGALSANPIEDVLNRMGFWTLVFLTLTLVPTPLKLVMGWKKPLQVRRMLGLFTIFYGSLHVLTYVVADQALDLPAIVEDITKRPFITFGFAAFVLLIPLAVTSTARAVQRLGARRWQQLHRLVYVAAVFGVLHFAARVKADHLEPGIFGAAVGLLLLIRLVSRVRNAAAPQASQRAEEEPS